MNDSFLLKDVANFVEERISNDMLSVENYISTENLLPDKAGVKYALSLPSSSSKSPAYKRDDILISNIRPYLKKIWFADKDGGCSADVLVLRSKNGMDSKFLYYALFREDFFVHAMKGAKGTKMPRGDKAQILEFTVPKFSPKSQKAIAAVLTAIDSKINCNIQIIAELESIAKTLYDYWFLQFDFPDISGRPYKSSGGPMVYNDALKREIPESWKAIGLNYLLTSQTDSITSSAIKDNDIYTPIEALPIRKMSFGYGQSSTEANTSLICYKNKDILIGAMRVYFHRVCIAPFDGITRTTTLVLRPKEIKYLPFLYQVCNEERAIDTASKISVGTQQPYVNWENSFENYMIPYPDNNFLIEEYSSKMEHVVQKVITLEKENAELAQLRNWLLPLLMNGQVTIS